MRRKPFFFPCGFAAVWALLFGPVSFFSAVFSAPGGPVQERSALPAPVRSLFAAAEKTPFSEKSCYLGEGDGEQFSGAFTSVPWKGFSDFAGYCTEENKELRLEHLPLMNMFEAGKCRRVERKETPDGGWTYDFVWIPNNGKGEEQVLLTVNLSESGITVEENELTDSTLSAKNALRVLEHIRLGVLRWSVIDAGASTDDETPKEWTLLTPLFAPVELADTFEPSPSPISVGDRLKKQSILPDLNFDARTEMKIVLTSCAGLAAETGDKTTTFSALDGPFKYDLTFAVAPTGKNADDRQILTIALINGLPADKVVEQVFYQSGIIEQVEAKIIEKEYAIGALESSYVDVPMISSPDPREQQRLFSERKRLEKKNRNIDNRIRHLSTQIARDRKSLDVELNKRLKRNLKFFQKKFAVTYKILLANSAIGPDEFLLCDSFSASTNSGTVPDADADEGNGLEEDISLDADITGDDDQDAETAGGDSDGGEPFSEEDSSSAPAKKSGRTSKTKTKKN